MNIVSRYAFVVLMTFLSSELNAFPFEINLEKVYKVKIPGATYKVMSTNQVLSKLETFIAKDKSLDVVKNRKIRDSITVQFVQDNKKIIKEVEFIITSNDKEAIKAVKNLRANLKNYVSNDMVNEFRAEQKVEKVVKPVVLNDLIVNNLSNEEIQVHLTNYFNQSKEMTNPEIKKHSGKMEIKIIVNDQTMKIWQVELISTLPKEKADKLLTPLQNELKKYVSTVILKAATEKNNINSSK